MVKNIAYARDDFWTRIPEDCKKAISELKRMKVCSCCAWDYEDSFAQVWWLVLHEVDMWVEGEFRAVDGGMTRQQAKKADDWLIKYLPLFNKYKRDYPDDWRTEDFSYGGQV